MWNTDVKTINRAHSAIVVAAHLEHRHVGSGLVSVAAAIRQPVGSVLPADGGPEVCERDTGFRAGRHRCAGQCAVLGALAGLDRLGGTGPSDARPFRLAAGEPAEVFLLFLYELHEPNRSHVLTYASVLPSRVAHILPGLCFIAVPYISQTPFVCIAIMTLSQALNGAAPQSTFATFHDIAPNYAVTMVSIINTVGSLSGLIAPLIVAYETSEQNTIAEWRSVFVVGAIGYIGPALLFFVAGSASVQPWDSDRPEASIVKNVCIKSGKHVANTTFDEKSNAVRGVMYGPMYVM